MFKQDIFQGPGTGTFSTHTFEILFMLLVAALIGLWLGWLLWSHHRQKAEKLHLENTSLSANLQALRKEMEELKARYATAESERAALETQVQRLSWENNDLRKTLDTLNTEIDALRSVNRRYSTELGLGLPPEPPYEEVPLEIATPAESEEATDGTPQPEIPVPTADDLQPIDLALTPEQEDPGLQPADVRRTEESIATPPIENKDAPASAGVRFIPPVPRGTMIPIDALQDPPPLFSEGEEQEPIEEPEASLPPIVVFEGARDDLKVIEGIGPKIEQILFSKGITTYGQLAATSVQQLKDILAEAGPRYAMHDPGTWSAQALLAANGEWENLRAYQEFLHGGKRPEKT